LLLLYKTIADKKRQNRGEVEGQPVNEYNGEEGNEGDEENSSSTEAAGSEDEDMPTRAPAVNLVVQASEDRSSSAVRMRNKLLDTENAIFQTDTEDRDEEGDSDEILKKKTRGESQELPEGYPTDRFNTEDAGSLNTRLAEA
jgi:hypothetical protein